MTRTALIHEWDQDFDRYPLPICYDPTEELSAFNRRRMRIERDVDNYLITIQKTSMNIPQKILDEITADAQAAVSKEYRVVSEKSIGFMEGYEKCLQDAYVKFMDESPANVLPWVKASERLPVGEAHARLFGKRGILSIHEDCATFHGETPHNSKTGGHVYEFSNSELYQIEWLEELDQPAAPDVPDTNVGDMVKCENCGRPEVDQALVDHTDCLWCLDCMRRSGYCLSCNCDIRGKVDDYENYEDDLCPDCAPAPTKEGAEIPIVQDNEMWHPQYYGKSKADIKEAEIPIPAWFMNWVEVDKGKDADQQWEWKDGACATFRKLRNLPSDPKKVKVPLEENLEAIIGKLWEEDSRTMGRAINPFAYRIGCKAMYHLTANEHPAVIFWFQKFMTLAGARGRVTPPNSPLNQ